ncbi:MAG TPA: AMP-binding protein, partial [Pyrinomonadaceae bacterium]
MSEHSEGYRLSPQQRRLQRVSGLDPGRYCARASFEVEGRLDVERLRAAVRSLVERHEVLRTGLARAAGAGEALQVIGDGDGVVFEVGASHACVDEWLRDTGEALGTSGEDALRVRCEQVDEGRWQVCLSVGSLWSDAAGMAALCGELWREYAGDAAPADEPLQYADVSEVMNELLEAENTKAGREFWEKQNPPARTTLSLPAESTAAQAHGDFDPQCIDVEVGDELREQFEGVCARHNVRAEDFLLACWQSLLHRLSTQTDIEIATAFDGRNYEGLHEALGLFVRYLPLRAHIDTQTRFEELLLQTAESAAEFSKWQEYYTPTQTHAAQHAGTHVEHPFGFDYLRWPTDLNALDNADARLRPLNLCAHTEPFRVKLVAASSTNGRLRLQWHYDPRRFDSTSVRRLAAQYLRLLASATADPACAVARLELLTDEERHTSLVEWNRTEVDYGGTHCLHRLFEQQAARTPAAIALAYEDERLTYAELNDRANRLARLLSMKGVGPDVVVGLMMERSVEMVAALLAILKAGGAYLPLDPEYPADRLSFMLADSAVSLLLTQQRLRDRVSGHAAEVLFVDSLPADEEPDVDSFDSGVTPDHLAYIIYTSGSTGRPKGVMVSHRAISNRLLWMREHYPLTLSDALLQKTSLSFDASVWELFHPLQSGARLLLARPGGERDLEYLVETVATQGVTV